MKVKVITQHKSSFPNPIELKKGERVEIGKEDRQYPGWIWTILKDGNSGWAPKQVLSRNANQTFVLENYYAKELNTNIDDILTIHRELNGWYLVANQSKELGWVPKTTVENVRG